MTNFREHPQPSVMQISRRSILRYAVLLGFITGFFITPRIGMSLAQAQDNWFPCVQPWNDTLRSGARMGFFPSFSRKAAGGEGFLLADQDGHFRFETSTQPTRFVGVNFSFGAAMADSSIIDQVAPRMAKYGINVARLHHMDNYNWWDPRETLLALPSRYADTRSLNPEQLRRLSYTIKTLAANGIYSNLNLHVSRQFQKADGVANADSLPDYGKAVSIFDPRIRMLMKEYARNLLTTDNPYTGLRFVDDPRIAFVEITNENSLYTGWMWGALNFVPGDPNTISCSHSQMLDSLWCSWLHARYANTNELRNAWRVSSGSPLGNALINGSFESPIGPEWMLEVHTNEGAAATVGRVPDAAAGTSSARVDIAAVTGTAWRIQFKQVGTIPLIRDSQYTVSFFAKASHPRSVSVGIIKDIADYDNYGLSRTIALSTEWKKYSLSYTATGTDSITTRLSFTLGDDTGSVWLDDVRCTGLDQPGLEADESLASCTVRRVGGNAGLDVSAPRLRETAEFIVTLQKDFFNDMYAFLRDSIGVRCPITGTNWYAGLGDLFTQSGMDYIDNHAYWQHPFFPRAPWDASDWLIQNTPMTADTNLGTMPRLAAYAILDKPYVVSEYNHPAPSWFQSEMPLHLAAYASLQQWDGIYIYSYHHGHDTWDHQHINGFFDVDGNPAVLSLLPQMADIFRSGFLQAASRDIQLRFSRQDMFQEAAFPGGALFFSGLQDAVPLLYRVRVRDFDAARTPNEKEYQIPPIKPPYQSETQEILWNPGETLLVIDAASVQGCTGLLPVTPLQLGDMRIAGDGSFATVLWTSQAAVPLARPGRSLLTLVGRTENTGMLWDGTTTVHDHWGGTPALLQAKTIELTFTDCDSIRVYPLDSLGQSSSSTTHIVNKDGEIPVRIDPAATRTPWYGIERFAGATSVGGERPIPMTVQVHAFPNPADDKLTVTLDVPAPSCVRISLHDLLGRTVASFDEGVVPAGSKHLVVSTRNLPPGMYMVRTSAGDHVLNHMVLLVHR